MKYVCIHCHFYQPPRENAWLEQIELQDSAYPYHDWNERVEAECYAPNLAARILDSAQRITSIVNNYSKISFNFGPTLLSWAAEHAPDTYRGLLDADRQSMKLFSNHGSAMAQAYNHVIMPLANSRDKKTQVIWGFEDFVSRYGRVPEGMWLPETAVDSETLDLMAECGITFAVLAPHQARCARAIDGEEWTNVSGSKIDPTRAYRFTAPSGRTINLFFYDGPISQAVAFEKLLDNGEKFTGRLMGAYADNRSWDQLAHIATDGETYGHHHKHGEMALAYSLHLIESRKQAKITNYGEFLEKAPPTQEVKIFENTSWSCMHGIERWRSNCGCNSGRAGWNQEWRKPLREALDWLRDLVNPHFERLGGTLLKDPWKARDGYIQVVLDRTPENRERFGAQHFSCKLEAQDQVTVWKLMELQRHAMLMYTSCGWFFDDLSGIETVQVIQYAGRVVQLAEQLFGIAIEKEFVDLLAGAKSNLAGYGNGRDVYERYVKPAMVDLEKVGAHYSISSLFAPYGERVDVFSYSVKRMDYHVREAGKLRMALGQARFTSKVTQESETLDFWVVHFGDHNVAGGVQKSDCQMDYRKTLDSLGDSFDCVDIPEVVRQMDRRFGDRIYSLRSLFRDEQRRIVGVILSSAAAEAEAAYLQLYEDHAALMRFITSLGTPMPREFTAAVEYAINSLLRRACSGEELDHERITSLLREAQVSTVGLDKTTLEFILRRRVDGLIKSFLTDPSKLEGLNALRDALSIVTKMPFTVTLPSAQNGIYALQNGLFQRTRKKAQKGDERAQEWVAGYLAVSEQLKLSVQ